jgi:hypothetical protein
MAGDMVTSSKGRVAENSLLEALGSEIVAGTEALSSWIAHLQRSGGGEVLFELEAWLRGLDAFLDGKNLPLRNEERANLITRSFAAEIHIARLALEESERAAARLSRHGPGAGLEIEVFGEVAGDAGHALNSQFNKMLDQPTPIHSLACLLETINDLRITTDTLNGGSRTDFQFFLSLGRTFRRGLRSCRYIDMLLGQRFRSQFDRIDNAVLSATLRSIADDRLRHHLSLTFLYLFRFLHYLTLVSAALREDRPLRRFLVLFALLHEQTEVVCDFVRSRFIKERRGNARVRNAADLVVRSLRMEMQRVFERELAGLSSERDASVIYARIENSHGLLRNCYESGIVTFVQAFDESADGKALFPTMAEGLEKGRQLTKDLWDLRQALTVELEKGSSLDLSFVMERVSHFREASLRHLMYQDWGEFEGFSDSLISAGSEVEIRALLRKFVGFLEVLLQEVSKRSILQ